MTGCQTRGAFCCWLILLTVCCGGPAEAALSKVTLATTPMSPQPAYTPITLQATPTGAAQVEYRFRVGYASALGTQIWTVVQNYGTKNACAWTPATARYYTLEVSAREVGATAAVKAQKVYQVTRGTPPPPPTANNRIAFISIRDGNPEIYVMNADGAGQTRLTNTPALEMEHAWNPAGTRLVFVSRRTGSYELFAMDADGGNVVRLTTNGQADWGPSYTPDGARLLFFRTISGSDEIHSMDVDGSNEQRLTQNTWFDVLPVMTPDGQTIIFNSDRNGATRQANYDVYRMNADGTNPVRLTTNPGQDWYHAVSPDGKLIAYTCDDHIALMNLDGSNPRAVTFPSGYEDARPTFSPDGTRLAFASNRDGNWEIYVMNLDGSQQTRLTTNTTDDYYPCWGR